MRPIARHDRLLIGFLALLLTLFSGCGGNGDDDQTETVTLSSACNLACDAGCSRAAQCSFIPASQLNPCVGSCLATIERQQIATIQSCLNAVETFRGATCQELANLLGIPRSTGRSSRDQGEETTAVDAVVRGITGVVEETP